MPQTPFVTPNLWELWGEGILIRYSTKPIIFGGTHFSYQDGQQPALTFGVSDIRSMDIPDIGTLVSVTVIKTIDTGSSSFTVLLPRVKIVGPILSAPVSTQGIRTAYACPLSPPFAGPLTPPFGHGQQDFYTVIKLTGTAQFILGE